MTDETKNTDIESKTSIGTYIGKQIYQNVVLFGSTIGGTYAGLMAAKPFFKNAKPIPLWEEAPNFIKRIPGLKSAPSLSQLKWGGGLGLVLGTLTGGTIIGYEHWKKIKQSQLQVDEITKDISDIEVFRKADPELKAENERLWTELKTHDASKKTMTDKVGGKHHENWQDKATAQSAAATEVSR